MVKSNRHLYIFFFIRDTIGSNKYRALWKVSISSRKGELLSKNGIYRKGFSIYSRKNQFTISKNISLFRKNTSKSKWG